MPTAWCYFSATSPVAISKGFAHLFLVLGGIGSELYFNS